eukprot:716696-Rhodomonas_salina.1
MARSAAAASASSSSAVVAMESAYSDLRARSEISGRSERNSWCFGDHHVRVVHGAGSVCERKPESSH